jgi:hypothetical protein
MSEVQLVAGLACICACFLVVSDLQSSVQRIYERRKEC